MKPIYLFDKKYRAINMIKKKLANSDIPVFVFLDYDGTIVPIHKKPIQAILSESTRTLLNKIAQRVNAYVGIVSGRSMKDVRRMVKLPSLFYIANHGFEIYSKKIKWKHPQAADIIPIQKKILVKLKKALRKIQGTQIENKHVTLSVHYRQLSGTPVYTLKKIIKSSVQMYSRFLKISSGKKVFEIKPKINWNKGKAILKFLELFHAGDKPIIMYFGDDRTDEDAFRVLAKEAFTIYVGSNSSTRARYYVKHPDEVILFLNKINHSLYHRKEK